MISCISQMVSQSARRRPGNAAVIEAAGGRTLTYKEMYGMVCAGAANLAGAGVGTGDRVGLISRNSADFLCAYFAVSAAGAVPVPLNYTLHEDDIIRQARISGIRAIFYEEVLKEKALKADDGARPMRGIFKGFPRDGRGKETSLKPSGRLATIIFTSGTTGGPLGVMLSHRNIISNASAVASYTGLRPSDRIMCVLPFHYIYGISLAFSHFLAGATVIIDNRFAYPKIIIESMERFRATGFAGVSSHYSILLNYSNIRKKALPSLRYFMQAGDAMPEPVTRGLVRAFPGKKVYLMYGQTEAAPRLAYLDPALAAAKPSSVGKAIPGVTIKIADSRGRECMTGQAGEIVAKGDNIMIGYWRNRKETAKVLRRGWLHTGDVGFKDGDGDIFIKGRVKGFVKVGAQKANPSDAEKVALGYGGVGEAAAVAVRDRILGNKICIFVSPLPLARIDIMGLKRLFIERLPRFGRFIEVKVLASLPKNNYGKIDRKSLEARI